MSAGTGVTRKEKNRMVVCLHRLAAARQSGTLLLALAVVSESGKRTLSFVASAHENQTAFLVIYYANVSHIFSKKATGRGSCPHVLQG